MTTAQEWLDIAADVAEGIASVGPNSSGVGNPTLLKPGVRSGPENDPTFGADLEFPLNIVSFDLSQRDQDGNLVLKSVRTLLIAADISGGVVPEKDDNIRLEDGGPDIKLIDVRPLAPGGVNLMFEADIAK